MNFIKISLIAFSLLTFCSCEKQSSNSITGESQNSAITEQSDSSTFVMPNHEHGTRCNIYSQDSEQENNFIYKLNKNGLEIIGINPEIDASTITELRIPLKHNGININSVTNLGGAKLTSCKKIVFPEEFDTIQGIGLFPNLEEIVLPRKLVKLDECSFIKGNYEKELDITWTEDCLDFTPPNNNNYATINYPYNCEEINLPDSTYVHTITIYGSAKTFSNFATNYSNIREVYCLSGYLTDETLKTNIIKLESIKHSLDIKSNISKSNGIYFYQDDKTTFPIAFDMSNDVAIFPESFNGKKYGIKSKTFYNHIPKNIVFSKEILYCEQEAFFNAHSNCFFETDENPENFDYWFWPIDGSSGTIDSRDDLINIYYKSEWSYVDGMPTPNK